MGWIEFAFAFGAFFLSHSVPLRPPARRYLQKRFGRWGFTLIYSALSLGILAWLIRAAGRAPFVPLWDRDPWHGWFTLAVMLSVCLIIALSIARPNPFSFGGLRDERFDPERPGLVRWTRHPLLLALSLWAAAHVVANGDLAHVILFGSFAVFAWFGGHVVDCRKQREMGSDWNRLIDAVARAPLRFPSPSSEVVIRLVAGVALFGGLIWLHPLLLGVSPLS